MHAHVGFLLPKHPNSRWHDDDDDDDDDDDFGVKIGERGCTLDHKNRCEACSFVDASYATGFSLVYTFFAPNKPPSMLLNGGWKKKARSRC